MTPLDRLFDAVFVISLPGAEARRRCVERGLGRLGCHGYQVVEAVDGRALDLDRMKRESTLAWCEEQNRPLMPGEVGCYLSHVQVMETMLSRRLATALVCEDDIVFEHDAARIFAESMAEVPSDWDIIHFHSHWQHDHPQASRRRRVGRRILEGHNESQGTLCYAITARCALYLSAHAFPIRNPIDGVTNWPTSEWCKDYRGYIVDPFPCRPAGFTSEIGSTSQRRRQPA